MFDNSLPIANPTSVVPIATPTLSDLSVSELVNKRVNEGVCQRLAEIAARFQKYLTPDTPVGVDSPAAPVSLMDMIDTKYNAPRILLKCALQAGETVLLVGRQKEGKSTLSLQLAIDLATGSSFLE